MSYLLPLINYEYILFYSTEISMTIDISKHSTMQLSGHVTIKTIQFY